MVFGRRDGLQLLELCGIQRRDLTTNTAHGSTHNIQHTEHRGRAVVFAQPVTSCGIPGSSEYIRFAPPGARPRVFRLSLSTDQFHCDKRGEMNSPSEGSGSGQASGQLRGTPDTSNSRRQSGSPLASMCGIWQPSIESLRDTDDDEERDNFCSLRTGRLMAFCMARCCAIGY